jgi:hypothetical protein
MRNARAEMERRQQDEQAAAKAARIEAAEQSDRDKLAREVRDLRAALFTLATSLGHPLPQPAEQPEPIGSGPIAAQAEAFEEQDEALAGTNAALADASADDRAIKEASAADALRTWNDEVARSGRPGWATVGSVAVAPETKPWRLYVVRDSSGRIVGVDASPPGARPAVPMPMPTGWLTKVAERDPNGRALVLLTWAGSV